MMTPPSARGLSPRHTGIGLSILGGLIWLLFVLGNLPSPFEERWGQQLLLFAALVLVPQALVLVHDEGKSPLAQRLLPHLQGGQVIAGLLLLLANVQPLNSECANLLGLSLDTFRGLLALPWLAFTATLALVGVLRLMEPERQQPAEICLDMGLIYLVIGGFWVVLDRFGVQPLAFPKPIVLLTAIHFHYAGMLLPILAGLAARELPGKVSTLGATCVIIGPPLVAAGITAAHYQVVWGPYLETIAALIVALAGLLVGGLHLFLATHPGRPPLARFLWAIAGLALLFSMVLAALYGLRHWIDLEWEDEIGWMRALHGTANALGFGLVGTAGWMLRGPSNQIGTQRDTAP